MTSTAANDASASHASNLSSPEPLTGERLHKSLARAGISSRRAAELIIREGRVRVNGEVVRTLGSRVDPNVDRVHVDGKVVRLVGEENVERLTLLLNKPPKVLTTTKDDRGRKTVLDLVSGPVDARIYPVGRLDFDAEGALLLTNDGDLAHKLTHPRFGVPKTYAAKVKGVPSADSLDRLVRGIYLEDGPAKAAHVEIIEQTRMNTWVEITVTEGRNRLVKRMFWRIRHPVLRLVRVRFAHLGVEGLRQGQSRMLTKAEMRDLRAWVR